MGFAKIVPFNHLVGLKHERMRPRLLLVAALLIVAVATPGALGTTMCKVDADFDGAVAPPNVGDGDTCSSLSTFWLGPDYLNKPSWADVTCDALVSTTYTVGSEVRTVGSAIRHIGAACCGSLAKTRCFDASTICKVDADFDGAKNLGDLGLGASGSTCSSYIADAGWLGWTNSTTGLGLSGAPGMATSWSDVTCDALLSATYTRDSQNLHHAADMGRVGAACCGSIAKTRCFGAATMCKVDADFIGTATDPVIGPTCAAAAPSALVNWAGKFSWNDVTCESMASTSWYSRTGLENLQLLGPTCCGSLAKTRCVDSTNMCKLDADFKDSAPAGVTVISPVGDISLTCGGAYGILGQALSVWRNATKRPTMTWSTASCADMTKDLTPHFNFPVYWYHELYLKGTMKEFLETYGAACCGGLAKTRDPCEVILAAPESASSVLSRGQHVLLTVLSWSSPQVVAAAPPATTTPAPSPPASTVIADTDTKYFVTMTVTMPYRSVCADGLPRSLSPDPKCYLRSP
jgi:hypothetical protein